ncbi:MAG: hypothetical protein Q4D02_05060 [Clostridia bacterium]|nr:hypothetical protein [Clostridia bacterium]
MLNNKVKVSFENGKEIVVTEETTVLKAMQEADINVDEVFAVIINNNLRSIFYPIIEDCTCKCVTYFDREGERIYSRSLRFILLMALYKLYPEAKAEFTNKNGRDYFAFFENFELTEEVVANIKAKMNEIIAFNFKIEKKKESRRRIIRYYRLNSNVEKINEIMRGIKDTYTVYECDGYYNYLFGNLVPYTGYIKGFDLKLYQNGIALMLPERDNINLVKNEFETNRIFELSQKFARVCKVTGVKTVSDLNEAIINNRIGEVIRRAELYHTREILGIAERIVKANSKIVLLAGPSSSGKTTTAQRVADALMTYGKNASVISMDNYFNDLENIPIGADGKRDYETFDNIDLTVFKSQMLALLSGKEVVIPEYDFKNHVKIYGDTKMRLGLEDIIIIEGIHGLNPKASNFMPKDTVFKLYVNPSVSIRDDSDSMLSSSDLRLIRRAVRDFSKRGMSVEETFELWENVRKGDEENIFPYVNEADYVFNSALIYEMAVLKNTSERLFNAVKKDSNSWPEARRILKRFESFLGFEQDLVPSTSIAREFIGGGCYRS